MLPQKFSAATTRSGDAASADVVAVRTARCQAPGAHHCEVVTVRLAGGPDKGKETSLRFGDAGGSVSVGLGDKLLVYKNPLPPTARLGGVRLPPYSFSDFQ